MTPPGRPEGECGSAGGAGPALAITGLRHAWPGQRDDLLVIDALVLAAGEHLFLHGPSGSGKSTLLGLMAGVLLPRTGQVAVLGQDWAAMRAARRDAHRAAHVGVLFQQFNLLPWLDVLGNVLLPCRLSAQRRQRAAARHGRAEAGAEALLQRMQLPAASWRRPAGQLSVGQQQRVAAARALIGMPALVIADEPTSALDAALRDEFMQLLREECAAGGSSLVFVSHDERLAAQFSRRLSLAEINRARPAAAVPA
ncbi:ATP-binding cassette domain-containing protein [Piscinibacter sakaiensis]|uniref:ABC transporter, ATP-binding protein n=1 Tax=Piscinibacter sakaiensis TaxID=1547922 RepID=A0A0K8NY87_PISS1|nr:ATP-binding cassette domain-containing protein [Piscinibacter sakaiensis]GAP34890.1 ABC transporter, ATP-binding protein [Piscinibacter sakaiensis]